MNTGSLEITGIDHLVLTVEDIEASCRFYTLLGGSVQTFGTDRRAIHVGHQKINLHEDGQSNIEPVATHPQPGSADICLVTSQPISDVITLLHDAELPLLEGPVERTGAQGSIQSVYLRDPDENLVEVATYTDKGG